MVIDSHAHIAYPQPGADPDDWAVDARLIGAADRLGIEILVCSCLTPKPATPGIVRAGNDRVLAAMERWPDRLWMHTYVNPGHCREALDELDRTRAASPNVVGCKLYDDFACRFPVVNPVIERCIELGLVIVINQGHITDELGARPHYRSDASDIVSLARRFPQARLIADHIGGGGDWEWTVKTLAPVDSVSLEISGSGCDDGMLEMALERLGPDRLLFACDMSMEAGAGKLRALPCSEDERRRIAGDNFLRLCGRIPA